MRAVVALLVVLSMSGCWVSTRKEPVRRDLVWVQPDAPPIFVALVRDQTKTRSMLSHDHESGKLSMQGADEVTRETWIVVLDPKTGAATQLPSTRGFVTPLFWDAPREVLWARRRGDTVGFMKSGVTVLEGAVRSGDGAPLLPLPFVLLERNGRNVLYNLRTSAELSVVSPARRGQVTGQLDGSLLRLSSLLEEEGQLRLEQLVTDWSAQRPFSTPTIQMRSPPLDPAIGTRRSYRLSDDGRHLLEIVDLEHERRLIVHDVRGGAPPLIVPLPHRTLRPPGSPASTVPKVHVETLDLDTFLLTEDDSPCRRGHFFSRASSRLLPTPSELCILQVKTLEGSTLRLLQLRGVEHFAYRTPDGRFIDLGEDVRNLLPIGTSAIAFSRRDGDRSEVVRLERGTGSLRVLGSHPSSSQLLNVTDEIILTRVDARRLATQGIKDPSSPPRLIELPTSLGQ